MAGTNVGTAYLEIAPSAQGFSGKLQSQLGGGMAEAGRKAGGDAAKGFGGSFSSGIKRVVGASAALIAGIGVKDLLKDSFDEARESQKVGALTAAVIKSTGGAAKVTAAQIGDLSTAISNKTGIDDEQIQSSANMLLTFTNVRNQVGKGNDIFNQATQTITDMSAALGQDGKSSAIQLGKALNDPIKGVTALQRVGVSFTAQQKDQIKALVGSGKTLDAQKLILHELNKEFGGAAEAQATAGEKMKTAFKNLEENIGTALLPALDKTEGFITNRVIPGFQGLLDLFVKGDFTSEFGKAFHIEEDSKFVGFLFGVRDAFKEVVGGVRAFGAAWKANDGDVTSSGFAGVMEKLANAGHKAFDYLRDAIPKVADAAKKLWPSIEQIAVQLFAASQAAGISTWGIFKALIGTLPGILNAIAPVLQSIATWMGQNKEIVTALVVALTSGIAAFKVISAVVKAYTVIQGLLNVVLAANPIGIVIIAIAALTAGIIYAYQHSETFRNIVSTAFDFIKTAAVGLALVAVKSFHFLLGVWLTVAGGILDGAAFAFGWVPGLGPKLQTAATNFHHFKDSVNGTLSKIETDLEVQLNTKPADAGLAAFYKKWQGKALVISASTHADVGNFRGPVRGFASGGTNIPAGPAWVGEKGPELMWMPQGASVANARDSARIAAGAGGPVELGASTIRALAREIAKLPAPRTNISDIDRALARSAQ